MKSKNNEMKTFMRHPEAVFAEGSAFVPELIKSGSFASLRMTYTIV
jgi:hypothetical protein